MAQSLARCGGNEDALALLNASFRSIYSDGSFSNSVVCGVMVTAHRRTEVILVLW